MLVLAIGPSARAASEGPVCIAQSQHQNFTSGLTWLAVVFGAGVSGNHFDATSFKRLWQLIPFENLKADPFGSVWNLHIQPPLWNLLIGVFARLTPLPFGLSMQLLMAAFAFIATVLLFDTLHRIGVRARWAMPLTLFVMCTPDVLVSAFEPRYELAVTAGLGVLFELGEQQRSRSMMDPLVYAFGIVVLVRAANTVRAGLAHRAQDVTGPQTELVADTSRD